MEVPPCKRGANPATIYNYCNDAGKNRIDQRMPLEPGHGLPSPFQSKCKDVHSLKNAVARSRRNPDGNIRDKVYAVTRDGQVFLLKSVLVWKGCFI